VDALGDARHMIRRRRALSAKGNFQPDNRHVISADTREGMAKAEIEGV